MSELLKEMGQRILERRKHVFPAPAGINRVSAAAELCGDSVPRASGDKPASS